MISEKLLKYIETLAEEIISADPDNLKDTGNLYSLFEEIQKEAQSANITKIVAESEKTLQLLKNIMLDEVPDKAQAFDTLNESVSSMQHMTRPGADLENDESEKDCLQQTSVENDDSKENLFQLPEYIDRELFNEFLADQDGVLENMENALLGLEENIDNETIANLRRIFHTLKGEAAVFELYDIEKLCHCSEDLIEESNDQLPIERLLSVKDWLKTVFDSLKTTGIVLGLTDAVLPIIDPESSKKEEVNKQEAEKAEDTTTKITPDEITDSTISETPITGDLDILSDFVSEVREHIENIENVMLELERDPHNQEHLNSVFRVFHTVKGAAGFLALDDMAKLAHSTENLLDLARKEELTLEGKKIDVIFEALDVVKTLVDNLANSLSEGLPSYSGSPSFNSLVSKIKTITSSDQPDVQAAPPSQPETKSDTDSKNNAEDEPIPSKSAPVPVAEPDSKTTAPKTTTTIKESIKIDSIKLDQLIDAIGELVIVESMIIQDPDIKKISSSHLMSNIAQMDKITRELQQHGMSLRMVPVKPTFQKMARVVRDVAKKNNKKIDFILHGEDTMLDKSVVDKIGDPLIHLVRNSVDHGIENSPEDRVKAGKNDTGKVELMAFHKGGNIYIGIKDDGRGLNREAILKKAVEKDLIKEGQSLSDKEINALLFLPGFSTAKKVTDVSGRGVGMDVVRKNIEELRGSIEIESEEGQGSTFSLRLPLTLAIIDGMLVRVGAEKYIIPTLSIVESLRPGQDDITTVVERGEMIKIRDSLIPLFRLSTLFDISDAAQTIDESIVIVVEDSGKMTGIVVDELLGQQSTVIKNLGASFKDLKGISGGSIMADGHVGIILDIAGIISLATTQ